jgi:NAD(P)-dependent dehydrogenase (short-subunit alcohol dehydrogenase family)
MKLMNKVALITGGNSGIGLATAREFKANGAKVTIFGRNRETLDQAAASLGDDVLAIQGDVRNFADIDRLFEQSDQRFGKIDVLVSAAGIAKFAPIASLPETLFDELCDIHFKVRFSRCKRRCPICATALP